MSAQLPPAIDAVVRTALGAGVDLVLGAIPDAVRDLTDPKAIESKLESWVTALITDIIAPPVRVTAADDAEVKVTIRD